MQFEHDGLLASHRRLLNQLTLGFTRGLNSPAATEIACQCHTFPTETHDVVEIKIDKVTLEEGRKVDA
jgi:hypothetical protein